MQYTSDTPSMYMYIQNEYFIHKIIDNKITCIKY